MIQLKFNRILTIGHLLTVAWVSIFRSILSHPIGPMKTCTWLIYFAVQCALLVADSSANVFRGMITQTIVATNQPGEFSGDQAIGWYEYESDVVDGVFGTLQYSDFTDSAASPTLKGSVFGFFEWTMDGWLPFESTGFRSKTHLVVKDGLVADFSASGQIGGGDYGFNYADFNVSNLDIRAGDSYSTHGTVTFSSPVPVTDGAGDTGSLIIALILGIPLMKRMSIRRVA